MELTPKWWVLITSAHHSGVSLFWFLV